MIRKAVGARVDPRAWASMALVFATYFAWQAYRTVPSQLGIDLWQPWGVATVSDAVRGVGDPYADPRRYGDFLYGAAQTGTHKLAMNAQFWARRSASCFEPTGTPLFYSVFRSLPRDFDSLQVFWALLLYGVGGAGTFMLARLRGWGRAASAVMATAALAFFLPLANDAAVANVNALQFGALCAMLSLLVRRPAGRVWNPRIVPALLVLLVAFKPNLMPVACAVALHRAVTEPPSALPRAVLFTFAGIAIAFLLGTAGIGADAWVDWWRYLHGMNGGTVLYTAAEGNQAPARMLADQFPGLGVTGWSLILCAALGALVCAVAVRTRGGNSPRAAIAAMFQDPGFAMSLGAIFLFAAAPLVWYHYYVFALLPIVWWGLRPGAHFDSVTALVILSVVLFAAPTMRALSALSAPLAQGVADFAWVPLAVAMLVRAAQPLRALHR